MEKSAFWTTNGVGDAPSDGTGYVSADWRSVWRRLLVTNPALEGPIKRVGYNYLHPYYTGTINHLGIGFGFAIVNGYLYFNDTEQNISVSDSAGADRKDRVVLRADITAQTIRVVVIAGTAGNSTAPSLVQDMTGVKKWDIPLATISITNAGVITVTDERVFCRFADAQSPIGDQATVLDVNGAVSVKDGGVVSAKLADALAIATKIAALAATTAKFADGMVTADKIADGAVDSDIFSTGSIDTSVLADSGVNSTSFGTSAVTTGKIADGAVTSAKVGSNTIAGDIFATGYVSGALIADFGIIEQSLAASAVDTAALADSAVTAPKLADNATPGSIFTDAEMISSYLADLGMTTDAFDDGSVTAAKLADGAVTAAKLADAVIGGTQITDGLIATNHLASLAVLTAAIADNAVTSAKIADGTIGAGKLPVIFDGTLLIDGATTTSTLADASISTAKIADSAVTRDLLGMLDVANFASGAVTVDKLIPSIQARTASGVNLQVDVGAFLVRRGFGGRVGYEENYSAEIPFAKSFASAPMVWLFTVDYNLYIHGNPSLGNSTLTMSSYLKRNRISYLTITYDPGWSGDVSHELFKFQTGFVTTTGLTCYVVLCNEWLSARTLGNYSGNVFWIAIGEGSLDSR